MKPSLKNHIIDITNTLDMLEGKDIFDFSKKIIEQVKSTPELIKLPFDTVMFSYISNGSRFKFLTMPLSKGVEGAENDEGVLVELVDIDKDHRAVGFGCAIYTKDNDDESQSLSNGRLGISVYARDRYNNYKNITDTEDVFMVYSIILPILNAIILLNCKNVKLIDEPRAPLIRMMNRHKKKKKIIYKVLHIHRITIKNIAENESYKTGIKRAMHICRGHLRTYSEEKPLFGKVAGTFFIPAHIRGDEKEGTVVKDYELENE